MEYNPFTLKDKCILVTGASSGIGRAIAIHLSKMGANLMITGRNVERLQSTLSELVEGKHKYIVADLSNEEELEMLVNELPMLDGVVHCAGVNSLIPCKQITREDVHSIMGVNFLAPIMLQKMLLKQKKINKGASIVFLASKTANYPIIGNAVYSASKAAIISYSKCLALEVASRKVRVNCICPAMVWTDLITKDADIDALHEDEKKYPLKRYGQPDDIAYLCIYLLSDASSWMTGSSIEITGGL